MREEYSTMNQDPFPTIERPYQGDTVTLHILLGENTNLARATGVTVVLASTIAVPHRPLNVQILYTGKEQERARLRGYWQPAVRKHGFFMSRCLKN
jgi:predicted secreted hydrolase